MTKHYSVFLTYGLQLFIDGSWKYYIGAHARPSQDYLTEEDVITFSGNPLNNKKIKKMLTTKEYRQRVKLIFIEEYENKEQAYSREKELIMEYKEKYGDSCVNKTLRDCSHLVRKHNSPESNLKRSMTMKGRKLSDETKHKQSESHKKRIMDTESGKIYDSMRDLARDIGVSAPSLSYGVKHGSKRYQKYKFC